METKKNTTHRVSWTPEKIATLWDYYSSHEGFQDCYFSRQVGDYVYNYAKHFFRKKNIETILDYGCGQGHMIRHILSRMEDHQVCYGIDFSPEAVAKVNRDFRSHARFNGAYLLQDRSASIDDGSMDLIFVLEVVEHLDEKELDQLKDEISRLLRKGGFVVLTTPNRENLEKEEAVCPDCGCVFHRWQHIRSWTPRTLAAEMEKAGLKPIHVNETNFSIKNVLLASLFLKMFPRYKRNLIYIGQK